MKVWIDGAVVEGIRLYSRRICQAFEQYARSTGTPI